MEFIWSSLLHEIFDSMSNNVFEMYVYRVIHSCAANSYLPILIMLYLFDYLQVLMIWIDHIFVYSFLNNLEGGWLSSRACLSGISTCTRYLYNRFLCRGVLQSRGWKNDTIYHTGIPNSMWYYTRYRQWTVWYSEYSFFITVEPYAVCIV